MKASDYLEALLHAHGARRAYGLQGGAVVHLFDSLEQGRRIACHYMHHEESAALAAVADAKVSGSLGVVVVTTGPGGTNALTGLLAAWQDSVPVVFISGQTRLSATSYGKSIRQLGSQEFAILNVVKPMTKYAKLVRSGSELGPSLCEAVAIAKSGRPGPVWLDIPLDVQWAQIPAAECVGLNAVPPANPAIEPELRASLVEIGDALTKASKPLILVGHGVHLSGASAQCRRLIEGLGIPAVATWGASDLLPTSHSLNGGVIGVNGMRGANRLVHECDLLLVLGANLGATQTGSAPGPYAPQCRKIVITYDKDQLAVSSAKIDEHLEADLAKAIPVLSEVKVQASSQDPMWHDSVDQARRENRLGSVDLDSDARMPSGLLSTNIAIAKLSSLLAGTHDIVVDGGGTALYGAFQSATRGEGRRMVCSTGMSSMGTGLAETVGTSLARGLGPILTIIGDGSFLMNIQDLASIAHKKIPAVIALINNAGYLAIRHTQRDYLSARYFGTYSASDAGIPCFRGVVEGFGLRYVEVTEYSQFEEVVAGLSLDSSPIVLDIKVDPSQDTLFRPGLRFMPDGRSIPHDLSDMWPHIG